MAMGTGKSRVVVELIKARQHQRVLIVCPKSVLQVWPKEFGKYSSGEYFVYPLVKGTVAEKAKEAKMLLDSWQGIRPVVLVINYESAREEAFASFALKAKFDLVVADESHRLKAPSGITARLFYQLGKSTPYRLALSGTPLAHSPLDAFGQYKFLSPSIFGTSYTSFRARYCMMDTFAKFPKILRYQNLDDLHRKFYSIAYRVTSDVIDLPAAQHLNRYCELGDKARKVYRALEREFYAEVESGEVTIKNALVKLLRLQQITGGHLRTDDGQNVPIDTAKLELLKEILEEIDPAEPVVVFARFTADLQAIRRAVEESGRSTGELSGHANDLAAWQEGKTTVLVVQVQSGAAGIDLTRARYCLYYSVGFSLGDYEQSLARVRRPGQTRPVTYLHLLCQHSIDEKVYRALASHQEVVSSILEGATHEQRKAS
jgi:SNF2 family DNA or RNA helicase